MDSEDTKKKPGTLLVGMRALGRHLKPFKGQIILLSLLGLISALANGFIPYVTGRFFDVLINLSQGTREEYFAAPVWGIILGVWVIIQLIANNVDWILDRLRRRADTSMHANIIALGFIHLFNLPLSFHRSERIAEILEEISKVAWRVPAILRTAVSFAPQFLSIIIGVALAASINKMLAGVLALGVLLYVILLVRMLRPMAELDRSAHKAWNEPWGDAASAVYQIESIKQNVAEAYEEAKLTENLLKKAAALWYRLESIWSNISFFQRLIVFATQLAVFILSVRLISDGSITVGELVALNGYAAMFFGPFVQLGHNWQTIQNGITAAAQAETNVFARPAENYEPHEGVNLVDIKGRVEFRDVSFAYAPGQPEVLSGVSFTVEPGEVVAFVGESGVGKSTTISFISGFNFPTTGSVLIDGVDTRTLYLKSLRRAIAVVPQEVALFNETIAHNIRYGNFEASAKRMEQAVLDAHLDEFIAGLPNKYETVVGERGVKLSVGQKQRVAIARAMLRDPKILILDEPTSALDAKTEQFITESLARLMRARTTFIIAHRLSTVRRADKILVFDKGRIVETGKHNELIAIEGGLYRDLYEHQVGLHA